MMYKLWWGFLALLFVLSIALNYNTLFFFALLLSLTVGVSTLWFRFCLHGVAYRRRLQDRRVFYGQETRLTIEITNAKPLPLAWLLVRDRFPKGVSLLTGALESVHEHDIERSMEPQAGVQAPDLASSLTDVLSLRWYERVQRTYRIQGHRRGTYTFGPAQLASGDVFGFARKWILVEDLDDLIVYPKVVPVEQLGLPAGKPAGEFIARRRVIQDPLRMATVREYVAGDSIRYIHWKNTAHLNQLQTKVFDPAASQVLVLFVDLQTEHNPYSFVPEYLELIITSAASIAVHLLDARQVVGLCVNGGPAGAGHWTFVPPGRSAGQGTRLLESLAPLSGFRLLPMHRLLHRSMPLLPYGCTAIVITARAHEELLTSLLTLQDAGHPTVLLTVGDQEPDIPLLFTRFHLGGRDAWQRLEALELA
jgi:uncharacterized protein (DUF58 family)